MLEEKLKFIFSGFDLFGKLIKKFKGAIKNYKMHSSRSISHDVDFGLTEIPFIGDLKIADLNAFIKITSQICPKCLTNRKTHYCVEPKCKKRELVCWSCDCSLIGSKHFMHEYTYALPLFCRSIMDNFQSVQEDLQKFFHFLMEEIGKMKQYLTKMEKIASMTELHLKNLKKEYSQSYFEDFKKGVQEFSQKRQQTEGKNFSSTLDNLLKQTKFYSAEECYEKEAKIFSLLSEEVNDLKWLNDPQKDLKSLLSVKEEDKKDLFLGSSKKIQFSEIDQHFKVNNEFYTENLKTHKIELKVESDFLNKSKYYEALVYHLKDVETLVVENAHMNQIRSPLTFKNLRELEFNCNTESDSSPLRIDNVTAKLESLTIRKMKDEDVKNLKSIIQFASNLKQINFEIHNKYDLSFNKDLADCIILCSKIEKLSSFTIKMRTESEVKRIYGYLSKFYKDSPLSAATSVPDMQNSITLSSSPLILAFHQLLKKRTNLNKLVIEGIKSLVNIQVLQSIEGMPNLINYRIYYDNIDILSDFNPERNKMLEMSCRKRKNIILALAKNEKFKFLSNKKMNELVANFLI